MRLRSYPQGPHDGSPEGCAVSDLYFIAFVAGPSLVPLFASAADFALGGRRWSVAVSILLALLAFGVSMWVTSHAYHIGNAY